MSIQSINFRLTPNYSVAFKGQAETQNTTQQPEETRYDKRLAACRRRVDCAIQSFNEAKSDEDKNYFRDMAAKYSKEVFIAAQEAFREHTGVDIKRVSEFTEGYELTFEQAMLAQQKYPELFVDYDDRFSVGSNPIIVTAQGQLRAESFASTK